MSINSGLVPWSFPSTDHSKFVFVFLSWVIVILPFWVIYQYLFSSMWVIFTSNLKLWATCFNLGLGPYLFLNFHILNLKSQTSDADFKNLPFKCHIDWQEPGVEAEFTAFDLKNFFKLALTVQTIGSSTMNLQKMQAYNKEIKLPSWLSEEDISYLANVYAKTGFAGGVNYYRCLDL